MRRRRPRFALALSILSLAPAAVRGQTSSPSGWVEAGVATLRQPSQPTVTAPTVAGELHADGPRLAARATAGATLAGANRWAAQGELGVTWLPITDAAGAWELGGAASALRYNGSPAASSGAAIARRHFQLAPSGGLWLGAGAGMLARPGETVPIAAAEGGAWLRTTRESPTLGVTRLDIALTLSLQRARLDTAVRDTANGEVRTLVPAGIGDTSHPFSALDATLAATWRATRLELTASATARHATSERAGLLGSAIVTGAWWVATEAAVTATAGTLAADPLRGLPARRLAMAGIRWRPGGDPLARAAAAGHTGALTPAADVVVRDGRRVLRVRAPGATSVEVRGDCTRWQPASLVANGGTWELPVALEAGTQHLVLRIDGGPWRAPVNLPVVDDEFGERAGLLVVP